MVRSAFAALIILWLPAAAASKPPAADPAQNRSFGLPLASAHRQFAPSPVGRTEVAPETHLGFGIFGMKAERSYLQPVTAREIDAPKQRRAAVGFSMKF